MKKKRIIIIITISLLVVITVLGFIFANIRINTAFASVISLKYHYLNKDIDVTITDSNDIKELKKLLCGFAWKDSPSCGFSSDISISFSDGQKNLTLCPACDGCAIIRVGDTDKYIGISDESRKKLDVILQKYGMAFPCV